MLLTKDEINELRAIVRKNGSPLIAEAVDLIALTGIRRSEVCRLLPGHINLEEKTLLVTERKRVRDRITYRKLMRQEVAKTFGRAVRRNSWRVSLHPVAKLSAIGR